jgi:hypothetical protein
MIVHNHRNPVLHSSGHSVLQNIVRVPLKEHSVVFTPLGRIAQVLRLFCSTLFKCETTQPIHRWHLQITQVLPVCQGFFLGII